MESTVQFLKTIADHNRLLILFLLKEHTLCVCDLQKVIPLTQGALSIQLKNLSNNGLLEKHRQGKWIFYGLSKNINSTYLAVLFQLLEKIENSVSVKNAISKLTITETCNIN